MLREFRELVTYHSRSTERFAEHDVHVAFRKAMRDLRDCGLTEIGGRRVLDLGCGQRFPFALQCAALGARVTALDANYVRPDFLPLALYRIARRNGLKRALKSTLRRLIWDGRYYRVLEANAEQPSLRSCQSSIDFVEADPSSSSYSLPSGSFDLIASNAVLEHVADVPEFAAEVSRLLDSGGYFWARIHNFYSLSGGHHMEWAYPDEEPSKTVPPWDHLREKLFPAWVYLNRLRPEQYKEAFAKHFEILRFEGVGATHEAGELEGEPILTGEIAAELESYPRELLLTRSWCLVAKKRTLTPQA
jgi:SAM-dependent methyltransferase